MMAGPVHSRLCKTGSCFSHAHKQSERHFRPGSVVSIQSGKGKIRAYTRAVHSDNCSQLQPLAFQLACFGLSCGQHADMSWAWPVSKLIDGTANGRPTETQTAPYKTESHDVQTRVGLGVLDSMLGPTVFR